MKSFKLAFLLFVTILAFSSCKHSRETFPQRKDLVDVVFASGSIVLEKMYQVAAQTEGLLIQSTVSEGDSITTGQLLFRLENPDQQALVESAAAGLRYAESNTKNSAPVWQKLQEQYLQLIHQCSNDSINFTRNKKLYETRAVSKVELDRSELAYKNTQSELKMLESNLAEMRKTVELERLNAKAGYMVQQYTNNQYSLKAWDAGVVIHSYKLQGELVKRGEVLAQIGSGDFLAKLLISETDVNKIRVGQDVFIELGTDKTKSHRAFITKVYPAFDAAEQSFIAEARFIDCTTPLRVGTQLQANVVVAQRKQALVIPSDFLLSGNKVILAKTKDTVVIETNIQTQEWVEVLSGLSDTDKLMVYKNEKKKK